MQTPTSQLSRVAQPYGTRSRRTLQSCPPTQQREFPSSMNLNPSTFATVISNLVESLERHGIRRIVLLNSYGGNDLKGFLREMYDKPDAKLFLRDWYILFADLYHRIFNHRFPYQAPSEMPDTYPLLTLRQHQIIVIFLAHMVDVAQLVRALDCGSRSRGFESLHPPFLRLQKSGT